MYGEEEGALCHKGGGTLLKRVAKEESAHVIEIKCQRVWNEQRSGRGLSLNCPVCTVAWNADNVRVFYSDLSGRGLANKIGSHERRLAEERRASEAEVAVQIARVEAEDREEVGVAGNPDYTSWIRRAAGVTLIGHSVLFFGMYLRTQGGEEGQLPSRWALSAMSAFSGLTALAPDLRRAL